MNKTREPTKDITKQGGCLKQWSVAIARVNPTQTQVWYSGSCVKNGEE